MLDEHTASGSLFKSINLQQNHTTPAPPPLRPNKSKLQEILIMSHNLLHNNKWVIKDIDITLVYCRYSSKI